MKHLAYIKAELAESILAGTKTCESRLSLRPHPARLAQIGDQIYFKVTGGDVIAVARVSRIEHYDGLGPNDVDCLADIYAPFVNGKNRDLSQYWQSKRQSRFATFLWLSNVRPYHIPKSRLPRSHGLAWIPDFKVPA